MSKYKTTRRVKAKVGTDMLLQEDVVFSPKFKNTLTVVEGTRVSVHAVSKNLVQVKVYGMDNVVGEVDYRVLVPVPVSKKCRVFKDGNSWCCVGPKFKNIQESASGFGHTPEEAYTDYLTDVTAMKAAKKLLKTAKKKKASDKGSRNTRIHKCIVKGFKKGANRAGVLNLALIKNKKFNAPLDTAEVTDLVRVEWERLNPPSK